MPGDEARVGAWNFGHKFARQGFDSTWKSATISGVFVSSIGAHWGTFEWDDGDDEDLFGRDFVTSGGLASGAANKTQLYSRAPTRSESTTLVTRRSWCAARSPRSFATAMATTAALVRRGAAVGVKPHWFFASSTWCPWQ